jgi:hypothetical protein
MVKLSHRFGIGMVAIIASIEEADRYPDGIELAIMKTEDGGSLGGY